MLAVATAKARPQTESSTSNFSLAKALGGKGEGATPEHMFALGYSACFASAMQFVAGQKKIHLPKTSALPPRWT